MVETENTTTGGVSTGAGLNPPDSPFRLTGSQAKTAYAIRHNCEKMLAGNGKLFLRDKKTITITDKDGKRVEKFIPAHWVCESPENLDCAAFLTLTLGDYQCEDHWIQTPKKNDERCRCPVCGKGMKFFQVFDAAESSRRFNNLARRVLKNLFKRAIVVTERHKNKAIHFHLIGVLRSRADIKTGFDFKSFDTAKYVRSKGGIHYAAESRYKLSASENLRALWEMLRDTLPDYGFGRAELTPIKKTGEAVACYVSKYIEKNICNRLKEDKRKKLVRYIGDWKTVKVLDGGGLVTLGDDSAPCKIKPNDFAWASKRATAWRGKARETAGLIGCQSPEDAKAAFGARWAFHLSTTWQGRTKDDLSPFLIADWHTRRQLTNDLANISRMKSPGWLTRNEKPMEPWLLDDEVSPGFVGRIYRMPKAEPAADFDAEFAQLFETGWKIWRENERERLKEIAARN